MYTVPSTMKAPVARTVCGSRDAMAAASLPLARGVGGWASALSHCA